MLDQTRSKQQNFLEQFQLSLCSSQMHSLGYARKQSIKTNRYK